MQDGKLLKFTPPLRVRKKLKFQREGLEEYIASRNYMILYLGRLLMLSQQFFPLFPREDRKSRQGAGPCQGQGTSLQALKVCSLSSYHNKMHVRMSLKDTNPSNSLASASEGFISQASSGHSDLPMCPHTYEQGQTHKCTFAETANKTKEQLQFG